MKSVFLTLAMLGLVTAAGVTPALAQTVPTFELRLVPDDAGDGVVAYDLYLHIPTGVEVGSWQVDVVFDDTVLTDPTCLTNLAFVCNENSMNGVAATGYDTTFGNDFFMGRFTFILVDTVGPVLSPLTVAVANLTDVAGNPVVGDTREAAVAINGYAGGPDPTVSSLNPPRTDVGVFAGESGLSTLRLVGLLGAGAIILAAAEGARRRL